jgi:hypothetical protein
METEITLEVRGSTYDVEVDGKGIFWTEVGGQSYSANSLERLRETVTKATRQSNLDVRFCRVDNAGNVAYGTATGIHASQRAVLVRWNEGKRETIQAYSAVNMLQPLSVEEVQELRERIRDAAAAAEQVRKFRAAHELNVWDAASRAAAESMAVPAPTGCSPAPGFCNDPAGHRVAEDPS